MDIYDSTKRRNEKKKKKRRLGLYNKIKTINKKLN
jgi:hypothetical protein